MSSNVEEFLIKFGFKGTQALKDIDSFFKKVEAKAAKAAPKVNLTPDTRRTGQAFDGHIRQYERFLKRMEAVNNRVSRFAESRNMALLRQNDPRAAQRIEQQFRRAITNKDVRTATRLNREVAEIAANYRKAARAANGLTLAQRGVADSTRNMVRSYASLFALLSGTQAINKVGQDFQTMRAGMLAASGTAEQSAKDLAFVDEQAVRLGLNLKQTAKDFVKLRAVNKDFTDDQLQEVFLGIAEASTVLGLSADDTTGALRAVQQMMSKGQIMSEEFKGQLAERLPIAFRALEQATGKTTAELRKMMEQGQLGVDVLPAFGKALRGLAKQGGGLELAISSARVQQARFITQSQKAADTIFREGFGEGVSSFFNTLTGDIAESEDGLKGLGQAYRLFFRILEGSTRFLIPILDNVFTVLGDVATSIELAFGQESLNNIIKFGGAALIALNPILRVASAIVIALDDLSALFLSGKIGLLEKALGTDIALGEQEATPAIGPVGLGGGLGGLLTGQIASALANARPLQQQRPVQVHNEITIQEDGSGSSRQMLQEFLGEGMHIPQ